MAHLRIWTCLVLLLGTCIGATAHWHEDTDSIIVKLESDPKAMETAAFSVQSAAAADAAGALGQPIGRHLRRIRLQAGEKMDHRLEHLRSLKGDVWSELCQPSRGAPNTLSCPNLSPAAGPHQALCARRSTPGRPDTSHHSPQASSTLFPTCESLLSV